MIWVELGVAYLAGIITVGSLAVIGMVLKVRRVSDSRAIPPAETGGIPMLKRD